MTTIEIKNQLLSHFFDHDTFNLDTDRDRIELDDDLNLVKDDVVKSVLDELIGIGMVKKVESSSTQLWILTQAFDSFNQNINISAVSAEMIADTINMFREANDITGDVCDKTKIKEEDIVNLINICHVLAEPTTDRPWPEDEGEDEEDKE